MKFFLLGCLVLWCGLGSTACTIAVAQGGTKSAHEVLRPGTNRAAVVQLLGRPQTTRRFQPATTLNAFDNAPQPVRDAKVSLYDEYRVSGSVLVPGDPYDGIWFADGYTVALFITGGLGEVVLFPITAVDVAVRATKRYRLRLWYDRFENLIDFDRRPDGSAAGTTGDR